MLDFGKVAASLLASIRIKKFQPHETLDPLGAAVNRLAAYEGNIFVRIEDGKASFTHFTEMGGISVKVENLPSVVAQLKADLGLFEDLQKSGATEVRVPKSVKFHPIAALFNDTLSEPSRDRKSSKFAEGEYLVTKDLLPIDLVLKTARDAISQMEKAMRASMKPASDRSPGRKELV